MAALRVVVGWCVAVVIYLQLLLTATSTPGSCPTFGHPGGQIGDVARSLLWILIGW
jgi:hypothetical protein